MLIEILSALFDEIGMDSRQRRASARAVIRTLCKLATYRNEVDAYLKEALGNERERALFHWWQNQRTNRDLIVGFWRGVFCAVHTQNHEYAEHLSGVPQRDIRYALSQLTAKDITEIRNSKLAWRKPVITDRQINSILKDINSTIMHYAYKLRFIETCEGSLTMSDIVSMLKLEAISLIIRYEYERSRLHIKNTVLRGLKSAWSELASYYKRDKRDAMPSRIVEDENGKHFEYENIRESITVRANTGEGDAEMENPALLAKCVSFDKELETKSVVKLIRKRVPRYGKYLSLVVFEDPTQKSHRKFWKWCRIHNKTTTTHQSFTKSARKYCAVTSGDEAKALRILSEELGITLPK